jgi:hypothetical protein
MTSNDFYDLTLPAGELIIQFEITFKKKYYLGLMKQYVKSFVVYQNNSTKPNY